MSARLEQLCIFMLENGLQLDVNEPVGRRDECIMPSYFMIAISFTLTNLCRLMQRMDADMNEGWYGISPSTLASLKGDPNLLTRIVENGGNLSNGVSLSFYLVLRTLKIDFIDGKSQNQLFFAKPVRQRSMDHMKTDKKYYAAYKQKKLLSIEFALVKGQEKMIQTQLSMYLSCNSIDLIPFTVFIMQLYPFDFF